jgi:hypothetical protein
MNIERFRATLVGSVPPSGLSPALEALWYDAQGNWEAAHNALQDEQSGNGAWVHAYLHRKEGDLSNAAYWYRRAGKPVATTALDDEWAALVAAID